MTGKSLSKAGTLGSSIPCAGASGLAEILAGARHWRVWHVLGSRELHHRYVRSMLGQLWLVLSTAIMIAAMASVWSMLANQPVDELVPFIGTGIVIWTYFSQVISDCTMIFVTHGNLYRNQKMNFSVSIYSVIYKNTMILAHSLIIVVGLILFFGVPVNWYDLQCVPALLLTWITMLWAGYVIAMICVRYRDIIQLINSWLMVLFFITPVLWKPGFLPPQYHFIIDYNPLNQFLQLLRNPFLGEPVGLSTWLSTIVIALGGALFASPVIGRYRHRVIFWT
jgi:ABC-type polysaccharide/polyol phosphate export permease